MEGLPVSNGGSLMLAPEMVSLIMDSPVTVRSRSPRSDFDEGEPSDEQWINNPLLSKRNQ